jgi:peptidoglycan/LPS O-acetylase OafA/YrhL
MVPASTSGSASPPDYRPDIDGLRALAVLLILFYHLNLGPFSGGYLGVDVFFVISGFLITRLIVREVAEHQRFDFTRFYVRRVRRILPALLVTSAITAAFAFLLLSPGDLSAFGGSLWTAALSGSNVFFYFSGGYFAPESQAQPLLHLWSLGVEEQFYVFWPLLLVLMLTRSRRVALWTAVAGAVSLLLAQSATGQAGRLLVTAIPTLRPWLDDAADATFYLTPFRVFEFAIGALMVWAAAARPKRPIVLELLLLVGLALILVPAVLYADMASPALPALAPCLGAALVIHAGTAQRMGWLLRNRAAVGVGLISYSIYLLHWPLIVLVGQYRYAAPTFGLKLVLTAAVLAGAAAMYRWVEQPFRRPSPSTRIVRPYLAGVVLGMLLLGVAGASVWAEGGWAWRLPPSRQGLVPEAWLAKERAYCGRHDSAVPRDLAPCQNNRALPRTIAAWGDSHALHLVAGLSEVYRDHNVLVFYRPGCIAASGFLGYEGRLDDRLLEAECVEHNRQTLAFLLQQPAMTLLLTNTKRDTPAVVAPPTAYVASQLRAAGHTVVLLGDFIRPGRSLLACRSVPAWLVPDNALSERCSGDRDQLEREWRYSDALLAHLPELVDVRSVQCPGGTCAFSADDGTPFFRDADHLTTAGAIRFVTALRDQELIAP